MSRRGKCSEVRQRDGEWAWRGRGCGGEGAWQGKGRGREGGVARVEATVAGGQELACAGLFARQDVKPDVR